MSVIAKMYVQQTRPFGTNTLVEMSCVCDDQLMASHMKENENYVFSQASPSGDARMNVDPTLHFAQQEELYLIFQRGEECPDFPGAVGVVKARCASITDYGGVSKYVEVCSVYSYRDTPKYHPLQVNTFNIKIKIMIDNPAASVQFEPGKEDYWIGIYRTRDVSMQRALELAGKSLQA